MKRTLMSILLAALPCAAAPNALVDGRIAVVHEGTPVKHKVALASAVFMVAGQMLDFQSSLGGHELNGMIGNGANGTFNAKRGLAVKGIVIGTALAAEWALHRAGGHDNDKLTTGINAGLGGLGFAAAIHNYGVKK